MSGFAFEEHKGYCVVRFETELHEMSWGDVEKEAAEVVQKLQAANAARMIVDLSPMELIQSGLVASLVRMWKATEGHDNRKVVVVTANEVVREVIRSAGLFKVFTVVDSREEGAYEIGVSKGAQAEQREKRVLAWVALPAAMLAAASLYPMHNSEDIGVVEHAELAGMLLGAFACITSVFSMIKDDGWRRGMGVVSLLLGLGVIGCIYANDEAAPAGPGDSEETAAGEDGKPPVAIRILGSEATDGEDGSEADASGSEESDGRPSRKDDDDER